MKLTKAEQKLIAPVALEAGFCGKVIHGMVTKTNGDTYSINANEVSALRKLEKKGIVQVFNLTKNEESKEEEKVLWIVYEYKVVNA